MIKLNERQLELLNATAGKEGKVSDKYTFISTKRFIEDMEGLGYELKAFSTPRKGLGKHMLSFGNTLLPKTEDLGGLEVRVNVVNSHDGSSSFELSLGIFRQVCSNGLMVGSTFDVQRVRHVGYAQAKVEKALEILKPQVPALMHEVTRLSNRTLTPQDAAKIAVKALELRVIGPIVHEAPLQLLRARRTADVNFTAWNVFNRVQENLLKGSYETVDEHNRVRYAREVKSVGEIVRLNRNLWDIVTREVK